MDLVEPAPFKKPDHGWTCFHCGETFTTYGTARDHFGFEPSAEPGCRIKLGAERGLLMALRRAEKDSADAWQAIHNETTDAAKAYHSACARHVSQLQTAEEAGYERGLYDRGDELEKLRAALADLAAICWRINDTTDRSEADRYYLASTNDWDALHEALHKHADTIRTVER